MQIDKNQILELLRSQGKPEQAQQAEGELPDQVDTEQHAGLLEKFGVSIPDEEAKNLKTVGDAVAYIERAAA